MSLITVIVPAYNCAGTVRETVESILRQQVSSKVEIIIVNDGSTDETKETIEIIANDKRNVRIINRQFSSGRPSIPRNEGIDASEGEYICFMDADDIMPEGYLAAAMKAVKGETQFVGSLKCSFVTDVPAIKKKKMSCYYLQIPRLIEFCKEVYATSGLVIPKKLIGDTRFENIYMEDWRFLIRLYEKGGEGKVMLKPRVFYREHEKSLHPKSKKEQIRRAFSIHKERYGLFGAIPYLFGYFLIASIKLVLESKIVCR